MLLARVHLHRREELAIGKVRQSEPFPAHTDVLLDVAVPGRDVRVADRPVDGDPLLQVRLEVEVTPAIDLASPDERLAADLIALDPGEGLRLLVGMRRVAGKNCLDDSRN
jgi:hypothetical protein